MRLLILTALGVLMALPAMAQPEGRLYREPDRAPAAPVMMPAQPAMDRLRHSLDLNTKTKPAPLIPPPAPDQKRDSPLLRPYDK